MKTRLLILFMLLAATVGAQKSINVVLDYTVTCAGLTNDGSYMVDVECKGKKPADALANAKKAAVHAVLFKGITGKAAGCTTQRPIVADQAILDSNVEFFKNFFDDKKGSWGSYVTGITGVHPQTSKVKGGYMVNVTLIVKKDGLRQMLEKEGVIRGLSSGF